MSSDEYPLRSDIVGLNDDNDAEVGDSGDELGVVSVTETESNVEMVVVGDESVESEAVEEMLCRC